MANSLSAKKRIRQNVKRRARNRWRKRSLHFVQKDFDDKLLHASYEEAAEVFRRLCSVLDKTAGKGVIHKNTAARRKSRMSRRLKAMKKA